jgi:pimeloyl-ACP methyl ester carboxylesterase
MAQLMRGLGFVSYFAQGGDWGSEVAKLLGADPASGCLGLHLNMFSCGPPPQPRADAADAAGRQPRPPPPPLLPEDAAKLERLRRFRREGSGYQAIQGTRPQSLGYALNDSPLGLACWIAEKVSAWADTDGTLEPDKAISMDDLLINVCLYWFSGSITSSMRLYYETLGLGKGAPVRAARIPVPCALLEAPHETFTPPRPWVDAAFNVVRYTKLQRGGHFLCWESPQSFARDVVVSLLLMDAQLHGRTDSSL